MVYHYGDLSGEKDDLNYLFNMYRLTPSPLKRYWDDYIAAYKETGDTIHINFFLHHYENELNTQTRAYCNEYNVRNRFSDVKQTIVETIIERIPHYDLTRNVPFTQYIKDYVDYAVDVFVNTNGGSVNMSINHYRLLKKVNAIYYRLRDEQLPYDKRIEVIRMEARLKTDEQVISLIQEGESFRYYESTDTDEQESDNADDESMCKSVAIDYDSDPASLYKNLVFWHTIFDAIENDLTYRQKSALLDFYGICVDCLNDTGRRKTNREIANTFELYSDSVIINDRKKAAAIIKNRLKEAGAID